MNTGSFLVRLFGRRASVSRWVWTAIGFLMATQQAVWWWGLPPRPFIVIGLLIWLAALALLVRRGLGPAWRSTDGQLAMFLLVLPLLQEITLRAGGVVAPSLMFYPVLSVCAALVLRRWPLRLLVGVTVLFLIGVWMVTGDLTPTTVWSFAPLMGFSVILPMAVSRRVHILYRRTEQAVSELEQYEQRSQFFEPLPGTTASLFQEAQQEQAAWLQAKYRERAHQLLGLLKRAIPAARSCVLLLYHPADERLHLELFVGATPEDFRTDLAIPIGRGTIGWAAKEGKPCHYSRLDAERQRPDYYCSDVTIRSLLVLPFSSNDRLEGVLCVDSPKADVLGEREESLMALTAGCLHTQLEDLRQQRMIVQKSREFSLLLEASQLLNSGLDLQHRLATMTELAQSIVQSKASLLCLVENGERRAVVRVVRGEGVGKALGQGFGLTDGLVSLIVKNRQPILLSRLSEHDPPTRFFPLKSKIRMTARSFLGLPLILQDRVIGLLVCTADTPSAFTATHQHLLSILCNQAAQAIADAQLHAEVERLASIDGLTGLMNHRAFHSRLHYEWEQAQRHGESLTLMMIDLDHFKRINDTYGHQAGDRILKQVSSSMARLVRKVDTVGRYGGEEFTVLLPTTAAQQAWKMAERIRTVIERSQFGFEGVTIPVTLSIGMASAPMDASGPDHLVNVADKALYWAKSQGRNRTVLYPELVSAMARLE